MSAGSSEKETSAEAKTAKTETAQDKSEKKDSAGKAEDSPDTDKASDAGEKKKDEPVTITVSAAGDCTLGTDEFLTGVTASLQNMRRWATRPIFPECSAYFFAG
ncbi:MAG: hypothetical protein ACLRMZ_01800 [Blautia marasmi]